MSPSDEDEDEIRPTTPSTSTGPRGVRGGGGEGSDDSRADDSSPSRARGKGKGATERPSAGADAGADADASDATCDPGATPAKTAGKRGGGDETPGGGGGGGGGATSTSTSASNPAGRDGGSTAGDAAYSRRESEPHDADGARGEHDGDGDDDDAPTGTGEEDEMRPASPPPPPPLPVDLGDVPRATGDRHAEILLGLFVRCGEAELSSLARRAGVDLSSAVACSGGSGSGSGSGNETALDSSTLTLVPEVMRTLAASAAPPPSHSKAEADHKGAEASSRSESASAAPPLIDLPASWKRSDRASLSLARVERDVRTRFLRARAAKDTRGGDDGDNIGRGPEDDAAAATTGGEGDEKEGGAGRVGRPPCDRKRGRGRTESSSEEEDDDDSSVEPPFRPFTLLYNECTMSAVSRWAATDFSKRFPPAPDRDDDDSDGPSPVEDTDAAERHFPAPAAAFRRCSVCRTWGHYEVECERMGEGDVVSRVAPAIRVQRTLAGFVERMRSVHAGGGGRGAGTGDGAGAGAGADAAAEKVVVNLETGAVCSRPLPSTDSAVAAKEPTNGTNDNEEEGSDEGCETKHSFCQACNSAFRDDDILLCDGCDAPYHFQCLDPPLPCVPEGDWFCHACSGYDSDVSSVADLEGCGGFVIEQRKRSMAEACDGGADDAAGVVEDRWSAPVTITKRIRHGGPIPGCEGKMAAAGEEKMASEPKPSSSGKAWAKRDSAVGGRKRSFAKTHTVSTGTEEEDGMHPSDWEDADAEEEDGIVILSRAQESVPDLHDELPDLLQSDMVTKEKSDPSRYVITDNVLGCIVAWRIEAHNSAASNGGATDYSINNNGRLTGPMMLMGSIISVDQSGEAALVRALPRFQNVASSLDVASLQNSEHGEEGCRKIVRGPCDLGSSFWIPLKALKLIATPRPAKSGEFLEHRLEDGVHVRRAPHVDHTYDEVYSTEARRNGRPKGPRTKIHESDETGKTNPSAISASPSALSHSLSPTDSRRKGMDPAVHSHEESVYQAERILDERSLRVGGTTVKQFLVKWKSFDMEDCTWEPQVDKLEKELRDTVEAQDCSSVTSNVIEALKEGRQRLLDAEGGKKFNPVGRVCPFCQNWFKSPAGLMGHLRKHTGEPNYGPIREASKLGYDQVFGTS